MSRFVLNQVLKIKNLLSNILPKKLSKYHYLAFFVFLLVSFFAVSTKIVSADMINDISNGIFNLVSWLALAVSQLAIGLSIFFLRYFITLASYNNYIDVSVVKIGWVMVRDVANMFFVVALLVIAFATILGVEKYEWKKGLMKIIVMAILINFSNLIAQLIIDVAHVFTITFLNAVSASAGGNLINMFNLEKINSIVQGANLGENREGANIAVAMGSIMALLFSLATAVALGSYAIVMAVRVVVLWALIILSPLAFLFSAMPNGEKYASKWWEEFTKHVIVAPVMVFFLWLAFATLGTGQIMYEIQADTAIKLQQGTDPISVSISEVSTWENMANYIIGFIFLVIGLKMTQETGATGAGMVGSAIDFGKKAFLIGSGYALGRWMTGKGAEGVGIGSKAGGKYLYDKTGLSTAVAGFKAGWQERKAKRIVAAVNKTKELETKAMEAKNAGKKWEAFKYSFAAGWFQPVQRASKRAEDLQKAAAAFKEQWEESLSTSDTEQGQIKQRAYAERDEVKAKAQEKIRQKQQEQKALSAAMQEQMTLRLESENTEMIDASLEPLLANIDNAKENELNSIVTDKASEYLKTLEKAEIEEVQGNKDISPEKKDKMIKDIESKYQKSQDILQANDVEKKAEMQNLVVSDYQKYLQEQREKQKNELRSSQGVSAMNFDDIAQKRLAALETQKAGGLIKDVEYEKRKVEIESSRVLSKSIKEKLGKDKDIIASQEKIDKMADGDEKAEALAKLEAEKTKKFKEEFEKTYASTLLQTRESEFFTGAAMKMAGGDAKGAKKKETVLRRYNNIQDIWRYSKFVSGEQSTQAKAAAVAEEIGKYSRQKQELTTAKSRDTLRIAQKKTAVFEQQVKEKHFKENKEEMDALNYREITKQGGIIAKKIADALKVSANAIIDPSLRENLASIMASAASRGSEEAGAAMEEILGAVGFEEKISANDMLGQQRKMLSILLGRNVSFDPTKESESMAVQKAYEEFVGSHGDDKAQAILKYIDSALKNAGGDGLVHVTGLFDDKNLDKNGRVRIQMQRDVTSYNGTKTYMAERQKSSTLTGIDGIVNQTTNGTFTIKVIDKNGDKTSQVDQTAKSTLVKTLNAIKTNTQLTSAMKQQLSDWYASNTDEYDSVLEELSEESKRALEAVVKKTKSTT